MLWMCYVLFRSRFYLLCSDHRLPMASSLVPWIREVFLFSSRLHLSPVSCSLRLSVKMIPWLRPQQKMTPPPFYSVNRRVVYCCQLRRPLCSHTLLHDHQSNCQRPHRWVSIVDLFQDFQNVIASLNTLTKRKCTYWPSRFVTSRVNTVIVLCRLKVFTWDWSNHYFVINLFRYMLYIS